jgi:fatty-acyl-CoA synthase
VTVATARNYVWEAYEEPRDDGPQLWFHEGARFAPVTWDEWRRAAERAALGLRRLGIGRGDRVAAVLTNTFEVCAAVPGTWLAGATLLSLPTMRRGITPAEFVAQLRRLARDGEARLMLLEERYIELLGDGDLGVPVRSFEELAADGSLESTPLADEEVAFVQYSSGSTSEPKGCMLSMGAISEQERMLADRIGVDASRHGAMWLPLSHDMGLFGAVLLAWTAGMRVAVTSPERFLRKPQTWMEDLVELDANIAVSPSFGLALAARRARVHPPSGSFPMRTVVIGGERIEWSALQDVAEVLGPHGMTLDAFTPAYGLAEATLSVTMKRLDHAPHYLTIDGHAAYEGELVPCGAADPHARAVLACGVPMRGVSVRIDPPGGIGRICVRSPSVAEGYLGNPAATAERFVDGELITEDIGFLHDGELYPIGRTDDMIPLGGRNVFARDVEVEVERCDGVRPGCVALIDVPDGDLPRLVLMAELAADAREPGALADEMATRTYGTCGARVSECVFVARSRLPKTPSGKIQRFRCRALLASDDGAIEERVRL